MDEETIYFISRGGINHFKSWNLILLNHEIWFNLSFKNWHQFQIFKFLTLDSSNYVTYVKYTLGAILNDLFLTKFYATIKKVLNNNQFDSLFCFQFFFSNNSLQKFTKRKWNIYGTENQIICNWPIERYYFLFCLDCKIHTEIS